MNFPPIFSLCLFFWRYASYSSLSTFFPLKLSRVVPEKVEIAPACGDVMRYQFKEVAKGIFKEEKINVVYNGTNLEIFKPSSEFSAIRKEWDIPEDTRVRLFEHFDSIVSDFDEAWERIALRRMHILALARPPFCIASRAQDQAVSQRNPPFLDLLRPLFSVIHITIRVGVGRYAEPTFEEALKYICTTKVAGKVARLGRWYWTRPTRGPSWRRRIVRRNSRKSIMLRAPFLVQDEIEELHERI